MLVDNKLKNLAVSQGIWEIFGDKTEVRAESSSKDDTCSYYFSSFHDWTIYSLDKLISYIVCESFYEFSYSL